MKRTFIYGFIIAAILISGCNRTSDSTDYGGTIENKSYISIHDEVELKHQELKESNQYEAFFDFFDTKPLESPMGILCRKEDILIVDNKQNKIVVYDYNGTVIREVGVIGNGELEFLNPTGIAEYNDKIYVLDSLNYRIQILDSNLNYLSSIPLYELSPDPDKEYFWYCDIIVRNENEIYVTTSYLTKDYAKIYLIKDQKEQIIWRDNFDGYGTVHNNQLYFDLTLELCDNGGRCGQSYFLFVDEKDEVKQTNVPFIFAPRDMIATEEGLYVINSMYMSLDLFTPEGEYVETLYKFTKKLDDIHYKPNYIHLDGEGNFYITDNSNKTIIKVSKQNN